MAVQHQPQLAIVDVQDRLSVARGQPPLDYTNYYAALHNAATYIDNASNTPSFRNPYLGSINKRATRQAQYHEMGIEDPHEGYFDAQEHGQCEETGAEIFFRTRSSRH